MLIVASGVILFLFIIRFTSFASTLTIPLTLLAAILSSNVTFRVTNGAHVLARTLLALHISVCTAFIFKFLWSGNQTTTSAPQTTPSGTQVAQTNTCQFSYCVSPGSRVDLNTSNCTTHTENLAESLRKKDTGTDDALDRMCINFSDYACVTCNGACVDSTVSTCSAPQSIPQTRDSREDPPDEIWQLSNSELLKSWQMHS